jgi:adenine-specific DNA-methyltransferase
MSDPFVFQPMYTYLGNKRKLIDGIERVVVDVKQRLGKDKLCMMDGFTGSTVVARMFAKHAHELHTNDTELYSYIAANCFLRKPTPEQQERIEGHLKRMNELEPTVEGVIASAYSPKETSNIQPTDRCFFTHENGMRLDTWRRYIEDHVEEDIRHWCLCPVLVEMSTHANTLGHFKAFMPDFEACGKRVQDPFPIRTPVWCPYDCTVVTHNESTNTLVEKFAENTFDLVYFDPPYNEHEYTAFYFLLNVLVENKAPENVNARTGLPKIRFKSAYNKLATAVEAMTQLVHDTMKITEYMLVSYNDEGIIPIDTWLSILEPYDVERIDTEYQRYAANGSKTGKKEVVEILWLVKRRQTSASS